MNCLKRKTKNSLVNKWKLVYIPLFIGLFSIITVSLVSYTLSKKLLLEYVKEYGISIAKQMAIQIDGNSESLELVNSMIEEKIDLIGKTVNTNKDDLSNDLLKNIAKNLNVDEISWYSPEGKIIYSNIDANLGWQTYKGHPVENFRISGKKEFLTEEIRIDTLTGKYSKFGYIRNTDGTFMQIGISADKIHNLTKDFEYQNLVDKLAQGERISRVIFLDKDLKTLADSDINSVGTSYDKNKVQEMEEALNGKTSMSDFYYKGTDKEPFTVYTPVVINGEINNALVITFSTEKVYTSIYMLAIALGMTAIIMVILIGFVQKRNILKPINRLNTYINEINIEKNIKYRLPLRKNDTFWGLAFSINSILDQTNSYFNQLMNKQEELKSSNEELSTTYEQLAASDEELRAQYEEIKIYTEELEKLEQELEYIAYQDPLTNLPNRRKLMEELEKEIHENKHGAVMLLDLDNFKAINDTIGHKSGDMVLIKVAEELQSLKHEKIFISRFGGDEFLILIKNENDVVEIENYAKNIVNTIRNELIINMDKIYMSCSVGITLYPYDSNDIDQLLINADASMYEVKASSKNNYMFFNSEITNKLQEHSNIEKILREAIKNQELKLLYQPQVCTSTGEIIGFEALLRLKNHMISPAQFIPVAEETGIIIEIGRWVTKEAIKQIVTWEKNGFEIKPVAINFSPKQLNDSTYIEFFSNTLKEMNVEAKYIHIEITESIFLEKKSKSIAFLNQLKALGTKIVLDDFGTGYSSLNYLTFLPVDIIKLDKSINDKFLDLENIKVMESLISLAHSLNLEVVAEGIERENQYECLNKVACDYIQGYLFSKPLESAKIEEIYSKKFQKNIEYEKEIQEQI